MIPGFDDPATASIPTSRNLYFEADRAVAARNPGRVAPGSYAVNQGTHSVAGNLGRAPLMFGAGTATTGKGEPIVHAANSSRGHWSEVFNFHGSPAPWILIGLLLVAGFLHLSAHTNARVGFEGAL